jgi:hypothetical protein
VTDTHHPLPFSLDWLAGAANQAQPQLGVCPDGHLKSRSTCWKPVRFAPDLHALFCEPVDHEEGGQQ